MVSLTDLVDIKRTVTVRGEQVEIAGITAETLGQLINSFPELRMALSGHAGELSPQHLISMGPRIVASVIAAGVGKPGDAAQEAAAAKLALGEQLAMIEAIFEVTFPTGVGPFVEKLRSWGFLDDGGIVASGWAQGTNSQKPSSPLQVAVEATTKS
jgi:hypothetical protein